MWEEASCAVTASIQTKRWIQDLGGGRTTRKGTTQEQEVALFGDPGCFSVMQLVCEVQMAGKGDAEVGAVEQLVVQGNERLCSLLDAAQLNKRHALVGREHAHSLWVEAVSDKELGHIGLVGLGRQAGQVQHAAGRVDVLVALLAAEAVNLGL